MNLRQQKNWKKNNRTSIIAATPKGRDTSKKRHNAVYGVKSMTHTHKKIGKKLKFDKNTNKLKKWRRRKILLKNMLGNNYLFC